MIKSLGALQVNNNQKHFKFITPHWQTPSLECYKSYVTLTLFKKYNFSFKSRIWVNYLLVYYPYFNFHFLTPCIVFWIHYKLIGLCFILIIVHTCILMFVIVSCALLLICALYKFSLLLLSFRSYIISHYLQHGVSVLCMNNSWKWLGSLQNRTVWQVGRQCVQKKPVKQ